MHFLADKVLSLHLPPGHVCLDDVVVLIELEPERTVRLLEPPGRAVYADPGRHDAVRLPGFPDGVPQLRPLLERHVELPAEVADVRDPRGDDVHAVDTDGLPGGEREALVRDVVARDRGEDVARSRAPEA